jgi:hypothetical protein
MADDSIRYDAVTVQTRAQITPEGFLKDSPVIGRSGVQEYRRADGSTRREYRPPEVIFAAESLAAVGGIPIIDRHSALINSKNVRQHIVGSVLGSARQDGANMVGDIVIYDPTPVTTHGRRELSLAYGVRCDENPGTTPDGEAYDAKVIAITRYDHLAIVEKGRAGVAKLRLDADDAVATDLNDIEIFQKDDNMPGDNVETPPANNPPATPNGNTKMAVIRLDGIEYQAPPEVERALVKAQDALATATRRADQLEAERDTLQTAMAGHDAALVQARADGAVAARTRLQLEATAKEYGVEVRADATDRAIRETFIRKIHGKTDMNFDGKSDDYLFALYDGALEKAAEGKKISANNRVAVNGGQVTQNVRADAATAANAKPAGYIGSAAEARARMRMRHH